MINLEIYEYYISTFHHNPKSQALLSSPPLAPLPLPKLVARRSSSSQQKTSLRRLLRGTATVTTVGAGGTALYYASLGGEEREDFKAIALGALRAARAVTCWGRLVAKYKYLSRFKPSSPDASREEIERYEEMREAAHESGAELVLGLCRANGGLFIKMGQHAASLRPAVPEKYIERLRVLQDDAPQRSIHAVRAQIRRELPPALAEEIVAGLDPKPLGSASLAQVHKARLRDGSVVAVKVQHRDIDRTFSSDIELIKFLDYAASNLFPEEDFSLAWAVREFEENLKQELDFGKEAANGRRMRALVESHPSLKNRVVIPRVDDARSTKKVLTMEFIRGATVKRFLGERMLGTRRVETPREKQQTARLARDVVDLFAAMIFTFGFVHCDPHFGNFLIMKTEDSERGTPDASDGTGVKLALLDHGLYHELDARFFTAHAALWRALVSGNSRAVEQCVKAMGVEKKEYTELLPLMLVNRPRGSSARLGEPVKGDEMAEATRKLGFEAGMSLAQLSEIATDVPVDLLFVLRTMHLVKDLHRELGGTNRDRFLAYGVASATSPDTNPPQTLGGHVRVASFYARFYAYETYLWLANSSVARSSVFAPLRWGLGIPSSSSPSTTTGGGGGGFSLSNLIGQRVERSLEVKEKKKTRSWKFWRRNPPKAMDGVNNLHG